MANPVPAGSDVSAGTDRCTNCGYELEVSSIQSLPPCPSCENGRYDTVSGGDSVDDPLPRSQVAHLHRHGAGRARVTDDELAAFYRLAQLVARDVVINGVDRGLGAYAHGFRAVGRAFPD